MKEKNEKLYTCASVNVNIPLLQAIHITGLILASVMKWLQMMFSLDTLELNDNSIYVFLQL
jgi:hypothetical protein